VDFLHPVEAVILIGLQGAGKSSFFQQRLALTHVRVSRDELKTRAREMAILNKCLLQHRPVAIDNTNVTRAQREPFLAAARAAGYKTIGYFFEPDVAGSLKRNAARTGKARVSLPGLFATNKRLQVPCLDEGFDELLSVRINEHGQFVVKPGMVLPERTTGQLKLNMPCTR